MLLNKRQVAEILNVSPSTVDRLRRKGELRPLRVNGQVRFRPDAVRAYLDAKTEGGASPGPLYRRLGPDEAPPRGCVEVEVGCGSVPPDPSSFRGTWRCITNNCPAGKTRVDADYSGSWLPRTPPAARCTHCGRKMQFVGYAAVEVLAPLGGGAV